MRDTSTHHHELDSELDRMTLPFVLGERELIEALPDQVGLYPLTKIAINGPTPTRVKSPQQSGVVTSSGLESVHSGRFARLLNLANGVAYGGGMGMPEWVMLDCALLPSFFAGWMTPASTLSGETRAVLNRGLAEVEEARAEARARVERHVALPEGPLRGGGASGDGADGDRADDDRADDEDEWIPTSEFCAIPRGVDQEIMGYSLYSLKRGLGVRAKALGLWLAAQRGVTHQVGVAQWSNLGAVRAHLRFGPLELIDPLTPLHTKAGETFIYRLALPSADALLAMALGEARRAPVSEGQERDEASVGNKVSAHDESRWLTLRDRALSGALIEVLEAHLGGDMPEYLVRERVE